MVFTFPELNFLRKTMIIRCRRNKSIIQMKKILILMIAFFSASSGFIRSQEKVWTLEECIKYAIDNNIQIKQQILQTRFQENTLEQSKLNLLPSLNGQASHNYSFGRALDETTYEFTDNQNIQSNNFYAEIGRASCRERV